MSRIFVFIAITMTFLSGVAYGTRNAEIRPGDSEIAPAMSLVFPRTGGIYRFEKAVELLPKAEYVRGEFIIDPDRHTMSFNAGEPVHVQFLADGDVEIAIVLPDNEEGVMPEKIVVSHKEFERAGLTYLAQGSFFELDTNMYKYDQFDEANGRRSRGYRRSGRMHYRNAAGGVYGGCVAYVCNAIGGCSGKVGNGVGMTGYLRSRGWQPLHSCSNPPNGSVASWSGGPHGKGHTGIWNGSGWCYDLGCGNPGSSYRFRNCVAPR